MVDSEEPGIEVHQFIIEDALGPVDNLSDWDDLIGKPALTKESAENNYSPIFGISIMIRSN